MGGGGAEEDARRSDLWEVVYAWRWQVRREDVPVISLPDLLFAPVSPCDVDSACVSSPLTCCSVCSVSLSRFYLSI